MLCYDNNLPHCWLSLQMVPEDESDSPRLLPSEFLVKFSHYLTCNAVLEKNMITFV